jgi:isopentenyl diphosphate isomerase/L-lactate dehydrogenase-like FMN-dependent dehydrogenase
MLAVGLGADAAFVGRPMFHALAAGGSDGAQRALEELGVELVESMRLAGCPSLTDTRTITCQERR